FRDSACADVGSAAGDLADQRGLLAFGGFFGAFYGVAVSVTRHQFMDEHAWGYNADELVGADPVAPVKGLLDKFPHLNHVDSPTPPQFVLELLNGRHVRHHRVGIVS